MSLKIFTATHKCNEYLRVLEGFPAYSLVLLRLAINLRTVIVTAAIHQGLNSMLHPEGLTSPFDLLALGRHHTIYFLLDEFA